MAFFHSGFSTTTNLIKFTSTVIKGFFQRNQTDTMYTDFNIVFDRINYDLLLIIPKKKKTNSLQNEVN